MLVQWKTIPSFPEYEASSSGLIRRASSVRGKAPVNLKPWPNSTGYSVVGIRTDGRTIKQLVHRLVCEAFHGRPVSERPHVDHKDGNPSNNYSSNLRWCDHSHNMANSRTRRKGLRGVSRKRSKWAAYGCAGGRTIYLGIFDEETSAARAYDAFALGRYGAFAVLNFPDPLA